MANVNVYLRARPAKLSGSALALEFLGTNRVKVADLEFCFDGIFPPHTSQQTVYESTTQSLVAEAIKGYNITVMAYGATSSGKTHTLTGTSSDPGLVRRTCLDLLQQIPAGTRVSVSCLEIYMEQIYDLLHKGPDSTVAIRELPNGQVYVEGLKEVYVTTMADIIHQLETSDLRRTVAATLMNERSSRSHSVFQLLLDQPNGIRSRVSLVDLAGSEKVKKSGASGLVLAQAQSINKSLFTLSSVIHTLSEKAAPGFVNYRDSKLTRLLQDSLGGNSKTTMIITCLPTDDSTDETLSTLRFGSRCKLVVNKPQKNISDQATVEAYKQRLLLAEAEIAALTAKLKSSSEAFSPAPPPPQPCEICPRLREELEDYKLREEVARSLMDGAPKDWEQHLIVPLDPNQPLSVAELRQHISHLENSQKFFHLRQIYLLSLLASRNSFIRALEKHRKKPEI